MIGVPNNHLANFALAWWGNDHEYESVVEGGHGTCDESACVYMRQYPVSTSIKPSRDRQGERRRSNSNGSPWRRSKGGGSESTPCYG